MRPLFPLLFCLLGACGTSEPERPSGERAMIAKAVADVDAAAAEAGSSPAAGADAGTNARP